MEKIIKDYYVAEGSKLVHYEKGANGVDCWFDVTTPYVDGVWYNVRQHRCLSHEDFELLIQGV